jgi:hypothetical protein
MKGDPLSLPPWLEGVWRVKASFNDVTRSKTMVSDRTPGYRMASVLLLPNIGNQPEYEQLLSRSIGAPSHCHASVEAARALPKFLIR